MVIQDFISKNPKKGILFGILAGFAFIFLSSFSTTFAIGLPLYTFSELTLISMAIIVFPFVEEFWIRGVMYKLFRTYPKVGGKKTQIAFATIITAAMFSIYHYTAYAGAISALNAGFIGALIFGGSMALLREYTGGIEACIIAHSMFNAYLLHNLIFAVGIPIG